MSTPIRLLLIFSVSSVFSVVFSFAAQPHPNVLFIAIDDLNDWTGCLSGHPQARTPHIDALAARGVLFRNAHCTSAYCNPSRTSVLTGLRPSTTGVYDNPQRWTRAPRLEGAVTLPQHFRNQGYTAIRAGKIFHSAHPESWDIHFPDRYKFKPDQAVATGQDFNGLAEQIGKKGQYDWGPIDVPDAETMDGKTATWAAAFLRHYPDEPLATRRGEAQRRRKPPNSTRNQTAIGREAARNKPRRSEGTSQSVRASSEQDKPGTRNAAQPPKPFFLAVGIVKPHEPWYVPRKYFDLHPLDRVILPEVTKDDLDDIPPGGLNWTHRNNHFPVAVANSALPAVVQAYLATASFVDAQVGRILDALESGPHRDNTIVLLWSDHGFHLGTKEHIDKKTLWEEATRVPLIFDVPEGLLGSPESRRSEREDGGGLCDRPVSLLDLYPTLIDLCGLPEKSELEGESLLPLLRNPAAPRKTPAITTVAYQSHSIRDEHFRYTRYTDGTEELYNHRNDPHEWKNRASDPKLAAEKQRLAKWLPTHDEPDAPRNAPR